MPVTINGNGSITGLSVGGLPNGSVNADSLASNAVTSAKLADGAATQVKRTYAAGEVIQIQQAMLTSSTTNINTNSYTDINFEATITPKFSNSKIIVGMIFQWQLYRQNKETAWSLRLLKAGSTLHDWDSNWYYEAGTSVESRIILRGMTPNYYIDTAGGTSAITYEAKIMVGHQNSSNNKVDFNAGGNCSTFMLTEIKV